jgi:hypothetical protein
MTPHKIMKEYRYRELHQTPPIVGPAVLCKSTVPRYDLVHALASISLSF